MSTENWNLIFQEKVNKLNKPMDSWSLDFDDTINAHQAALGWKQYIRNPFSRFQCSSCHHHWASSKSMVVFHMCLNASAHEGKVKVRRYKQKCKTCSSSVMETPTVDRDSLVDTMDKLMEKILEKCYGQQSDPSQYFRKKVLKGDHLSQHCEACQRGVCDSN